MGIVKDIKNDIVDTFEKSIEFDLKSSKLKSWKKLMVEVLKVFTPLM